MTSLDDLRLQAGQLQAVCDAVNAAIDSIARPASRSRRVKVNGQADRKAQAAKGARH
jgi:hypothetical protein